MAQYKDIFSKYPQLGLGAVIVKQSSTNTRIEQVSFDLPIGISLDSSCGYLILDGSDFAGGPYTMGVNLLMSVSQKRQPVGMLRYSTQDEFILGDNNHDNAFKLTHILQNTKLYALFGNIAATAMPHSQYMPPKSSWNVTHQILIYQGGCPMFPNQDQDTNTTKLNRSMQNRPTLYRVVISGMGSSAHYQAINKVFKQPIDLFKNDCLVHAVQSTTLDHTQTGAFNTETQLFYETVDSSP